MYKVGIMLMGKPSQSPKKVKQIIIEVEAKTKLTDILSYLIQLRRIEHPNVNVAIQKNGRPVSESSTIAQILRHAKPINNVIKLFLYDIQEDAQNDDLNLSTNKIVFQPTKQEKHKENLAAEGKKKQNQKNQKAQQQQGEKKSGFCCC